MNLPLLGFLPQFQKDFAKVEPKPLLPESSGFTEAVTIIRSNLLIAHSDNLPRVILVTSGSSGEGKSVLAFSLAASLCQTGKKVLLIEGDMRYPVMNQRMGLENQTSPGLSAVLSDSTMTATTTTLEEAPNLSILTAGASPSRPTELLSSQRLARLVEEWKTKFDFIVIDSPPVLPVADSQFLERLADATALVVRSGYTTRTALRRTYSTLVRHAKDPLKPGIGVVLNFVPPKATEYYYGGKDYARTA
jgi:capsular exopolysaccharide synthesis family protein